MYIGFPGAESSTLASVRVLAPTGLTRGLPRCSHPLTQNDRGPSEMRRCLSTYSARLAIWPRTDSTDEATQPAALGPMRVALVVTTHSCGLIGRIVLSGWLPQGGSSRLSLRAEDGARTRTASYWMRGC